MVIKKKYVPIYFYYFPTDIIPTYGYGEPCIKFSSFDPINKILLIFIELGTKKKSENLKFL